MRNIDHHGVDLSVCGPVFVIGEVRYRFNVLRGDSQRLGNYKLGGWYNDSKLSSFQTGVKSRGSGGFYALFDQVEVPFGSRCSNRGFCVFGSVTVAPIPMFNSCRCSRQRAFRRVGCPTRPERCGFVRRIRLLQQ
jgi:hypothetical protein